MQPLSNDPDSQWSKFFKDNDVLLQIDKDCRRLLPDISFFQHPTGYPFKTGDERNDRKLKQLV